MIKKIEQLKEWGLKFNKKNKWNKMLREKIKK
jgi:biotin operon repressor